MKTRFAVRADDLGWIRGKRDDPRDLCLHGKMTVQVGEETFSFAGCVSAAALRMLRTLTETHTAGEEGQQMLPCCGHFMIAEAGGQSVWIYGCAYGVDYTVETGEETVVITTESRHTYPVPRADYRREVVALAEKVEAYYQSCAPKQIPEADERAAYAAFWNEWHRRLRAARREMTETQDGGN